MTAAELIAILVQVPPETPIVTFNAGMGDEYFAQAAGAEIRVAGRKSGWENPTDVDDGQQYVVVA